MSNEIKIAPSLLSADFSKLGQQIQIVEHAGVDMLHIDVMDGHFVPNITVGPVVVSSIRRYSKLTFDVHLMIEQPLKYIQPFAGAGADLISFHIEAKDDPIDTIRKIKSLKKKAAIAINPATAIETIKPFLKALDMVLLMTVNPGFAGQGFIHSVLTKIRQLRTIYDKDIQVDGGINETNAQLAVGEGANVLVAGTYIFGSKDIKDSIERLKRCRR